MRVGVDLVVSGGQTGVLVLDFAESVADSDEPYLGALGGQCAIALERARLYERERATAVTLQRSRSGSRLRCRVTAVARSRSYSRARSSAIAHWPPSAPR